MFHTRCQVKQKQLDITTIQYTSPDLSLTDLRAKIAGAKRACEAKADTHVRRVSWFDLHWKAYEGLCLEDAHHATLSFFLHSVSWRKNSYDGCLEYYVVVKERGQREEQTSQEEIQRKLSQVAQLQAIR